MAAGPDATAIDTSVTESPLICQSSGKERVRIISCLAARAADANSNLFPIRLVAAVF